MMSVPTIVDDGNFQTAMQVNCDVPRHPFADKGDSTTFIVTITKRQDVNYYTKPVMMTPRSFTLGSSYYDETNGIVAGSGYIPISNGTAYLVDVSPARFVSSRLIEWEETYASLPIRREEYGTFNAYTNFYSAGVVIGSWSGLCTAIYVYEYSLNTPLPTLFRYYYDQAINLEIPGPNATFNCVLPNGFIQGDNSTSKIWMGKIYERTTVYVDYPDEVVNWPP